MQFNQCALAAGYDAPINNEARSTQNAAGFRDYINQHSNFTQTTEIAQQAHSKTVTSQISQLVLAGHAVHQMSDGSYMVCKYGLIKYCEDFAELQDFARRLGVTQ
jgi:hypothetical protein